MRAPLRELGIVVLVKALASALVLAFGFRAVSDDDFSRVVLAESWAALPKLDPTGTSWLPFPFWLNGAAMLAFGRSLFVARAAAFVLGLAAAALVFLAARRLATSRAGALWGASLAAVFPWSARLGVATVPELPTAALALYGASTLVGPDARGLVRLSGGLALFCATLSRYEVWPIALVFAMLCVKDAFHFNGLSRQARYKISFGGVLSILGPLAWIAWNRFAHQNAFDFLDRVSAYRRALGVGDDGRASRIFAYPVAMARTEPEVVVALVLLGSLAAALPRLRAPSFTSAALQPWARPAAIAGFQLLALSAALVKDGAPTHHPERALLVGLLLCALVAGDLAAMFWAAPLARPKERAALGLVLACSLALGLVCRRFSPTENFEPRRDEVALGEAARAFVSPGERVLVEAADYGHFAVAAALGRPEDVTLDRDLDPRKPQVASSFSDPAALAKKVAEARPRFVVARTESPALRDWGPPSCTQGVWSLWPVRP